MTEITEKVDLPASVSTTSGVKGLVDAKITEVPRSFRYPSSTLSNNRPSDISVLNLTVPIIDLGEINNNTSARNDVVSKIKDAGEKWGFFQVINHGIPLTLLEDIKQGVRRFHEEAPEVKKNYFPTDSNKKFVYSNSFEDPYKSTPLNWRDSFTCFLAPDPPNPEEIPVACRDAVMDYSKHVMELGTLLFQLLSEALGLDSDVLKRMDCLKGLFMLCHYYPPCPQPDLTLGINKHTDNSFLTLLLQDQIGGLQVLHKDYWVDVTPLHGAIVVNMGDFMQLITNDKFSSVEHRVRANIDGPRISVACFFSSSLFPNATVYEPIKELLSTIRAQQSLGVASSSSSSVENDLRIKEWEVDMYHNELAISQGIRIRRKPPSKAPLGYSGPFELRLHNADSPSNILEEITWYKDQEVSRMKELNPLEALKKAVENAPPTRDFVGALRMAHQRTGFPALIAEVKKASPSRGILKDNFDPVEIAQAYERGGAACLSVLTDQKYFKGGFENLEAIRSAGVKCPLLCKEFVVDPWQIYYARTKGADAVLLIAAILTDLEITYLLKLSKKLGLAALVEVHDEREMGRVLGIEGIELVGINNRSLETFKVDISNTKKLLEGEHGRQIREKDMIVVGESGLFTPDDIAYVQAAGVKAVLVGESIVKQNDPEKGIAGLFGKNISHT